MDSLRPHSLISDNLAVPHQDCAPGKAGDVLLMRDDDDGDAGLLIEFPQQLDDLQAGVGIQVAGWLVGKQDGRLINPAPARWPRAAAARPTSP